MEIIAIAAEVLTVAWFGLFLWLVHGLVTKSAGLKPPRIDAVGRNLIGAARLALAVGIPAMFIAEIAHQLT